MRRVDDAHATPADETGHTVSADSLEGHSGRGYTGIIAPPMASQPLTVNVTWLRTLRR